ncbi:leukocyte elastase inhibitor-like [Planococcus citri]|uniref:leukocyte elastase inhibitor-like n=1 Tax=Planococcus citri TaxID=170843 RepID=UPI0031F920A5
MILFIALILFTGNVCVFSQQEPVENEFSRNVKNSVNKLNVDFSKLVVNDLKPEGNFIFSPLNIYGALALVHLGATGTTKTELSKVLGLSDGEKTSAEGHENFGKLLNDIQNTTYNGTNVNIANGIFVQKGLKLKENYLKGTTKYYKSQSQQLDFAKGGPEATSAVNKWVSEKTNNRIQDLFKSELSKDTVILLASALYFAGKWADRFTESYTETKNFNTGLKLVKVPTMSNNESIPYVDNKDLKFEAISLPYLYQDFSMLIVLPHRNQPLKTLVNSLKPEQLPKIIESLKSTYVNYEIPRMKFRWSQDINEHLTKLGVKQMFDKAELGNMVDLKNVAVSKVSHVAEIEVNEEGTVASAVTAIQFVLTSLVTYSNPPLPFHADRPFLFSIYHRASGIILFTGVVQNPADESA